MNPSLEISDTTVSPPDVTASTSSGGGDTPATTSVSMDASDAPQLMVSIPDGGVDIPPQYSMEEGQNTGGDDKLVQQELQGQALMLSPEDDDFPNPYENLSDPPPVQYNTPLFIETPLDTSNTESEAFPHRLPSILRPGNPRTFDTPGSRRASMALLSSADFARPRPSFTVSEINLRQSYASDGDVPYEMRKPWEEPIISHSPRSMPEYDSLPVSPVSPVHDSMDLDNVENTSTGNEGSAAEPQQTPEQKPSVRRRTLSRFLKSSKPDKKSQSIRQPSKWKFWSKKEKMNTNAV